MGLLQNSELFGSTGAVVTGATTIRSAIVDSAGAEGVLFIIHGTSLFTAATTASMARWRVLGSSANSTAGAIAMRSAGTTAASTAGHVLSSDVGLATSFDYKVGAIDVIKPTKRYVYIAGDLTSDGRTIAALKYGLRRRGSTEAQDSTSIFGSTSVVGAATS